MLANQWYKGAAAVVFYRAPLFGLDYAYQPLTVTRLAHGNNQSAADLQLRYQRLGNRWSTGGDQYAVVRRVRGPAERAVETLDRSVVDPQLADACLRFAREIGDALDGINLSRDLRQHGSLVTGAGADLEHTAVRVELQQLSHARDDERLGDSLVSADRQSVIAVSAALQSFRNEEVARHVAERFEDSRVTDTVMIAQTRNHTFAGNGILLE